MTILGTVLLLSLPHAGIHKSAKPDHGQTRWELEFAVGAIGARHDEYSETLQDFGFEQDSYWRSRLHFNVALSKALSRGDPGRCSSVSDAGFWIPSYAASQLRRDLARFRGNDGAHVV